MQAERLMETSKVKHQAALFDRVGMMASSLCAVHCVLMPWLIMLLPTLAGTIFTSTKFENVFVGVSIFLAAFCGYLGCVKHGKWLIMALISIGALILCGVRLTAPAICCLDDVSWSHALGSAFGGSLLATSHYLNLKFSRQISPKEKSPCCLSEECSAHE